MGTVEITRNEPRFSVAYDDQQVTVERILQVLKEAGEPAKVSP